MWTLRTVLLLLAPFAAELGAQAPTTSAGAVERLEAVLEPLRAEHRVPALAACVLRGADVVALGAVGVRARGEDAAVTVDDLWHLGSCTKAMTATLCAIFVAEGRVSWGTTLAAAFPDLVESMHEDWRQVTVAQLLRHRAGMPANPNADGLWRELANWEGTSRAARAMAVEEVLLGAPLHEPGTAYLYSNTGYLVVGAILERLADRPWEDLMRTRLFEPLGMTSAGFGPPGSADELDQPRAHRGRGRGIPPGRLADNPAAIGPAGTVHASLRDWARFVALHLGALDREAAVVGADALEELHEPIEREGGEPYAAGWVVTRRGWADGPILQHAGSNTMWYAVVWAAPDADFAVLAVCNQGGADAARATDAACAAVISRFGPKVEAAPNERGTAVGRDP